MNIKTIRDTVLSEKKTLFALLCIISAAFGLRAYHFHDWIRFNNDQVRDAIVIDKMVSGEEMPLLGPKAGGTGFKLGPAFYYLEYIPASIFGNSPSALASLSVVFFLLSIPIFFIVTRKIFGRDIALALTFLYAISSFGVKYSRFTWNPNLLPFFTILPLYALHKITIRKDPQENRWGWLIAAGIGIGIGVQLHTLLLLLLPAIFLLILGRSILKKQGQWKALLITLSIAVFMNIPQIVSEIRTGGENIAAFAEGFSSKTSEKSDVSEKIRHASICLIQGHVAMLSAVASSDDCDLASKKNRGSAYFWPILLGGIVFVFGGLLIALTSLYRERDPEKKDLVGILLAYSALSFLLLVPLGEEVSLRFFIALLFSPFLLLGFWIRLFSKIHRSVGIFLMLFSVLTFTASNLSFFRSMYIHAENESKYFGGSRLGNIEPVALHIARDISAERNPDGHYFVLEFEAAKATAYLARKHADADIGYISWGVLRDSTADFKPSAAYAVDDIERGKAERKRKDFPGFTVISETVVGKYLVVKIRPLITY